MFLQIFVVSLSICVIILTSISINISLFTRNMQFTIIVINPKYGQLYYSLKKEIYETYLYPLTEPLLRSTNSTKKLWIQYGYFLELMVILKKLRSSYINYSQSLQITVILYKLRSSFYQSRSSLFYVTVILKIFWLWFTVILTIFSNRISRFMHISRK